MQAIRDGVIEATIDHEQGFMRSKVSLYIEERSTHSHCTSFSDLFVGEH